MQVLNCGNIARSSVHSDPQIRLSGEKETMRFPFGNCGKDGEVPGGVLFRVELMTPSYGCGRARDPDLTRYRSARECQGTRGQTSRPGPPRNEIPQRAALAFASSGRSDATGPRHPDNAPP